MLGKMNTYAFYSKKFRLQVYDLDHYIENLNSWTKMVIEYSIQVTKIKPLWYTQALNISNGITICKMITLVSLTQYINKK